MKRILYILVLTVLIPASCDFNDLNVDPTRNSDAGLTEILPVAIAQTMRNIGSIGARVTGTVVQHWNGISAQMQSYSTYLIDEQTLTEFWETGLYAGAMKDCALIIGKAQDDDQPYYEGIGKVLMAFNLGIASSFWGDVPYSGALQGTSSLKSAYDTQESVYASIQLLLDEAIGLFERDAVVGGPGSDDLIYGGNAGLWKAAAYGLKARYAMHLVKRDPDAAQKTLEYIDKSFTGNATEPAFQFGPISNESNPIALFGLERPNQMEVGRFLVNLMSTKNDPRRFKYWFEENGYYNFYKTGNTDLVRAQKDSPLALIGYTELMFLKAEALLRTGEDGLASQTYTMALLNSMSELSISNQLINPYLAGNAGFGGLTTFDQKLERLITQKYIALYGVNSMESWVDFRRTGYPALEVPENVTASFNPSLVIPERYLYPISERTTNYENYQEAIDRQGGHLMDVGLWAYKNE